MKKFSVFQKFITGCLVAMMLALSPYTVQAATVQATASGSTSLLTTGAAIYKITLANSDATNTVTFKVYDAPSTSTTYVTSSYTNTTVATASVITSYVDILGITEYSTNTVAYRTNVVQGALTNTYKILTTIVVPPLQTQVYTPAVPLTAFQGLLVNHSNSNLTSTIDYAPTR